MIEKIFSNIDKDLSWIKDKTIYLTKSGSHSYGTNIESSDDDFRGIAIPPKEYFFGFQKSFEQLEIKNPDLTIFHLLKIIKLAADNNPNCLEILFTEESDHIMINSLGEELLSVRDLFPSKLCKERFLGYAKSQFHRIKSHRDWILNPMLAKPERKDFGLEQSLSIPKDQLDGIQAVITKQLDTWNPDFEPFSESQKIWLFRNLAEMLAEMKITADNSWECAARKFGCAENFIEILSRERAYGAANKRWNSYLEWKSNRNPIRYAMEEKFGYDLKHALHLVRLTRMAKEILTTSKVLVKRPDAQELLDIRRGKWHYEQLEEYFIKMEADINNSYDKSTLRKMPDIDLINKLCISLIEKSLSNA